MGFATILFWLHAGVIVAAALAGLTTRRGIRTSTAYLLLSLSAIVGVLVLLGAHVVAIAHFLFCAGFGLLVFFVIDVGDEGRLRDPNASASHWLVILLGLGGAALLATTLMQVVPGGPERSADAAAASSFASVGRVVLVDQGLATVAAALTLLVATLGAGFLARRGID